jgi:hypothetical protein
LQAIVFVSQKEGGSWVFRYLGTNGIFNRCTGFIFAAGIITTAIRAKSLLARLSSGDSAAGLAFYRFKFVGDHNFP